MPKLFAIGDFKASGNRSNGGITNVAPQFATTNHMYADAAGANHIVPGSDTVTTSINAAVPAGNTIVIFAPDATHYWHLFEISLALSVAGIVQILDGASAIFNLFLPVSVTQWIPLPSQGIFSGFSNRNLAVKNTQGVAVDITINAVGSINVY